MALNPVDKLLAGYVGFVTVVIVVRGDLLSVASLAMLSMHVLFGILLFLFTRLKPGDEIVVEIHPLKDGTYGGQYLQATLPDGTTIAGGDTGLPGRAR